MAAPAEARRDVAEELIDEPIELRTHVPSVRSVRMSRVPQLMSKPTPPGEMTPSSRRMAATPPIGNP